MTAKAFQEKRYLLLSRSQRRQKQLFYKLNVTYSGNNKARIFQVNTHRYRSQGRNIWFHLDDNDNHVYN